jgi:phosphopantothenoylcysteine synthetase/decarboxylase
MGLPMQLNQEEVLRGKNVLVTAGPTWVAIDRVRVITSVFSGETGLRIARYLSGLGCDVTLFMGPGRARFFEDDWNHMQVRRIFYFHELKTLLSSSLRETSYDVIVHSSAVADFRPQNPFNGKIKSDVTDLNILLSPTPKLIDMIRTLARSSFLVAFKLEVGKNEHELIEAGWGSLQRHGSDLVIANNLEQMSGEEHVAFIIEPSHQVLRVENKAQLCTRLAEKIACHLAVANSVIIKEGKEKKIGNQRI